MILQRSSPVWPFPNALLTYLGMLVSLTVRSEWLHNERAAGDVRSETERIRESRWWRCFHGRGGGAGGSTESEVEVTPQYKHRPDGVCAQALLNLLADSNASGASYSWSLTVPELSFFTIGDFGRIEVGDRAGFSQSLIGLYASENRLYECGIWPGLGRETRSQWSSPYDFFATRVADLSTA